VLSARLGRAPTNNLVPKLNTRNVIARNNDQMGKCALNSPSALLLAQRKPNENPMETPFSIWAAAACLSFGLHTHWPLSVTTIVPITGPTLHGWLLDAALFNSTQPFPQQQQQPPPPNHCYRHHFTSIT